MHRRWNSALNVQFLEQHPQQINHCHALPPCLVLWPCELRLLVVSQTTCRICYVCSSHVGPNILKDHSVPPSLCSKTLSSGTPLHCRWRHWSFRMSHPWRLETQDLKSYVHVSWNCRICLHLLGGSWLVALVSESPGSVCCNGCLD